MPPHTTQTLKTMPHDALVGLLLGQFKPLLAAHGVPLPQSPPHPNAVPQVLAALHAIIGQSETTLQRWGLRFAQSLQTGIDTLPGWQTTAEFLAIANQKTTAEQRIASGAALAALLGDARHAGYLLDVIAHDGGADDADALIARRALSFLTHTPTDTPDWDAQVRAALQRNQL